MANIPFNKQDGGFRNLILKYLDRQKELIERGNEITIQLDQPGGYSGNLTVGIFENESRFKADWENADISRFPARIKATATALRDLGKFGSFEISSDVRGIIKVRKLRVKEILHRIASMQKQWSSEKTPQMSQRGLDIRQNLPAALWEFQNVFRKQISEFSDDLEIEGSDGIGRKTSAPWVRLFSKSLSPSATTGHYLVIHFSIDGKRCYVTVGCSSTTWNTDAGDLVHDSNEDLLKKTRWCKEIIIQQKGSVGRFQDKIDLGKSTDLAASFEKATALAEGFEIEELNEDFFLQSISEALEALKYIYFSSSQLADLPNSIIDAEENGKTVNPLRKRSARAQGYGLNHKERKAVEMRAMEVTKEYLLSKGYKVKDTSANKPYDFLARSGSDEIKVEVKGTTSDIFDSFLMTTNEVALHNDEKGMTALSLVSSIKLKDRGDNPSCEDGNLEFYDKWDISKWSLKPITFSVKRNLK